MLFARFDWFLNLGLSSAVHLLATSEKKNGARTQSNIDIYRDVCRISGKNLCSLFPSHGIMRIAHETQVFYRNKFSQFLLRVDPVTEWAHILGRALGGRSGTLTPVSFPEFCSESIRNAPRCAVNETVIRFLSQKRKSRLAFFTPAFSLRCPLS